MAKAIDKRFTPKAMILRNKKSIGLGYYYRRQHELICFAIKGKRPKTRNGGFAESDVWTIARVA